MHRILALAAVAGLLPAVCAAAEGKGLVFLLSRPAGAEVYLDGEAAPRGDTPRVLLGVAAGRHKALFRLTGYREEVREFEVKPDEAVTVRVELEARPAGLRVVVEPAGARVFLDGKEIPAGETAELPPGDHKVRVEREGYEPWETAVHLLPGRTRTLEVRLRKKPELPPAASSSPAVPAGRASTRAPEKKEEKPAAKPPAKVPKFIEVDCWVCGGTGHLQTMPCQACGGKGWIGFRPCQECNRTGRVEAVCPFCGGEGTINRGGRQVECPKCGGTGKPICPRCQGTGKLKRLNPAAYKGATRPCPRCDGTGRVIHQKCPICGGTGISRSFGGGRWGTRFNIPCYYCKGKGEGPPPCPRCQGTGLVGPDKNRVICPLCFGTGQREVPCPFCKGQGWVPVPR